MKRRFRELKLYAAVVIAIGLPMAVTVVSARTAAPAKVVPHAAPTVTGISPASGASSGGTLVTITGTGFQQGGDAVLSVNFGFTGASFLPADVINDTTIKVTSPAAVPGTVDVQVGLTLGEQSATSPSDQFTYTAGGGGGGGGGAAPTVTGVAPPSGPAGGGQLVTITGTGFDVSSQVTFGGAPVTTPITVVSATQITATTPAGTAGPASVLVTTLGGTNSANALYTYIAAPTVTASRWRVGQPPAAHWSRLQARTSRARPP